MILVTGASGFIGGAVVARAVKDPGQRVRAAVREGWGRLPEGTERTLMGDLAADTDWTRAVEGVDAAVAAELVVRDPFVELVEYERVLARGKPEALGRDAVKECALLVADRAVALGDLVDAIRVDLEADEPAMATAVIGVHALILRIRDTNSVVE